MKPWDEHAYDFEDQSPTEEFFDNTNFDKWYNEQERLIEEGEDE
jgi:hypothetical protein